MTAVRRLIVNVDDFGWDDDCTDAAIELMDLGLATSATIMIGCAATNKACAYAVRKEKNLSFGLHFNIVDGHKAHRVSSLTHRSGNFRSSSRQRVAALCGLLRPGDIAAELRFQLSELLMRGVNATHLDSHGHLHKFPSVARAMKPVLDEFGIACVRRAQNLYFRRALSDMLDVYCALLFPCYQTTEFYCAIDSRETHWLDRLIEILPTGVTELSIHPGYKEGWRRLEWEPLMKAGKAVFDRSGIALCSYRDLQP
jgi:chitin disaccharide deacetylase